MSDDLRNPADDLLPDSKEFGGFRARRPISDPAPGFAWGTHQVGLVVARRFVVPSSSAIPGGFKGTERVFWLKGFGRSFEEAVKMARGKTKLEAAA